MHSTFEKRHPPFPEKVLFFRHRFSLEMQLLPVLSQQSVEILAEISNPAIDVAVHAHHAFLTIAAIGSLIQTSALDVLDLIRAFPIGDTHGCLIMQRSIIGRIHQKNLAGLVRNNAPLAHFRCLLDRLVNTFIRCLESALIIRNNLSNGRGLQHRSHTQQKSRRSSNNQSSSVHVHSPSLTQATVTNRCLELFGAFGNVSASLPFTINGMTNLRII